MGLSSKLRVKIKVNNMDECKEELRKIGLPASTRKIMGLLMQGDFRNKGDFALVIHRDPGRYVWLLFRYLLRYWHVIVIHSSRTRWATMKSQTTLLVAACTRLIAFRAGGLINAMTRSMKFGSRVTLTSVRSRRLASIAQSCLWYVLCLISVSSRKLSRCDRCPSLLTLITTIPSFTSQCVSWLSLTSSSTWPWVNGKKEKVRSMIW